RLPCRRLSLVLSPRPPPRSPLFPYTTLFRSDPTNFDLPTEASTLEGYIAVGEYHFPLDASIQEILEIMIEPTMEEFERLDVNEGDRKSTRLNSSHVSISYAVFCLKKKTHKDD